MPDTIAIAAISGGSAVLGGAIGAGAAHWTTLRTQKLQADEEHFRHRQGVYHEFLDSAHEFMHAASLATKDTNEWIDWFRDFETKLTAVMLFGVKGVRSAASRFKDSTEGVMKELKDAEGATTAEKRQAAFELHESEINLAYAELIAAMRKDVGVSK